MDIFFGHRLHRFSQILLVLLGTLLFAACDDPVVIPPGDPEFSGTGVFSYTDYAPLADKPIRVFYHIPDNANNSTPILFVFHGGDRNASNYRNELIAEANQYGFMVFAPEFNSTHYPGGDVYNLGNVFVDGDNPSAATLNDESVWTLSMIEPLFGYIKGAMQSTVPTYDIYGHSAGAQFAHRLMMLKPGNSFGTIVASASGWYTVPDIAIDFPYGIGQSPVEGFDLSQIFSRDLVVMVGEADIDPNSAGLRHNNTVDLQGDNRLERAQHFYQRGEQLAGNMGSAFTWRYVSLPGVGHESRPGAVAAVGLLYR
jgi:pimeloyl-ACP methyl ester carboxylesterase